MADALPAVDDILGASPAPAPAGGGTTQSVDDILGKEPDHEDSMYPAVGKAMSAFADAATQSLKESESTEGQRAQVKAVSGGNAYDAMMYGDASPVAIFNEAALRGLILPMWNVGQAALEGSTAALNVAGQPLTAGLKKLGQASGGMVGGPNFQLGDTLLNDLPMSTGFMMPGEFAGIPHLPPEVRAARAADAIGVPEAVYMGTRKPTAGEAGGTMVAAEASAPAELKPIQEGAAEPLQPQDIHAAAYNIAPEVMRPYRELELQRDTLRQQIADAATTRDTTATAPLDAEIADLQSKVDEAQARGATTVYSDIMDKKIAERDDLLETARGTDSDDMKALRAQLQETDFKMRDLAPQVSEAYRTAQENMPKVDAVAAPKEAEATVAEKVTPAVKPDKSIVNDVTQKLTSAGRPQEEADAAAQLVAAHYQARSERFRGKKGTAAEMYNSDMADIKASKQVSKLELTQAVDKTAAGDQAVIPGAEKISDKELAERRMQGALKATKAQKPMDEGMFGDAGKQGDLFQGGSPFDHRPSQREIPSDNYSKNLSEYSPVMFRETSANRALELLPHGGVATEVGELHLADTVDMATGQGSNKGVIIAFDTSELKGTRNRSKPTSDMSFSQGFGEYYGKHNTQSAYQKAVSAIRVDKDAVMSKTDNAMLNRTINQLQEKGWIKTETDKYSEYTKPSELSQSKAGKITLNDNGKNTITLMKDANASTFIHETGHHWLDELMRDAQDKLAPADLKKDANTVRKWLGEETGPYSGFTRKQHEQFARGFERYLMEGTAPTRALATVFQKFKSWLTAIYRTVDKLRSPINADIRDVFDRLLTSKPEKTIIASEQEPGRMIADIHEADAEHTPVEHASPVRDILQSEVDTTAKLHEPEVHDELKNSKGKTGGVAGATGDVAEAPGAGTPAGKGGPAAQPGAVGGGGSQAGGEGGAARGKPAPSVYIRPPKEPASLADWVRQQGGMKDEGGDVQSILGSDKLRGGKAGQGLINKSGMATDDLALRAHEAGYFPEKGEERPSVNEFLDKLREDLTGNKQYSHMDEDAVAMRNAALEHNAEVDRLAGELGVNPRSMSREQFWSMVAEHKSLEEQERLMSEMADAHESALAEADRISKEFLESRGESWEPDAEIRTRTLEDLENEREQEEAAGGAGAGRERDDRSEYPAGSESPLPEGVQQRGVGTEPTGRTGAPAGESEPEGAGGSAGRKRAGGSTPGDTGADLIDKAGNIRLDNINTTEDVKNVLRESAARNDDFGAARRGVVSDGQVLDLAAALGVDPAFVDKKRVGEAFNAEQIKVVEKMLAQSTARVREEMTKFNASMKSEADAEKYQAALARHDMIQETFSAVTAEAGRALRALKKTQSFWSQDDLALNQFLQNRKNEGKTLNQLIQESQFGAKLRTPEQLSMFINSSKKTNFRDMVLQYYINALISGPFTHMRYSIGNAINALWTPLVEIPSAAAMGALRGGTDKVMLGEAGAQLYGLTKGAREGWRAAAEAFKTGISPPLAAERAMSPEFFASRNAIPGVAGKIINLPSNSVSAIHSFFKSLRYEQNISGLAYRQAMQEGLTDAALDNRIAQLTTHPTPEMMESATENSLKELYMAPAEYNSASANLVRFTNQNLLAKIIMPFMRIGSQITRNAFIERTPLGFLDKEVRANLLGVNGNVARDMQLGKITGGIALVGTTAMMAAEGLATGDGPNDPRQRAVWLLTHTPNTIQVGNLSIPYQGLGSLGMLMRFTANMHETVRDWNGEDGNKLATSFIEGISKSVMDENFMRGAKDALDAVYHPEEYGKRYLQDFATNWLPFSVGLGQVARKVDPYHRDAQSIFDAARAKIPGASETLLPRRDMFGQPIMNGSTYTQYANDPVTKRLQALQIGVGNLERKINGVPLSEEQYDDYSRLAGKQTWMMLHVLMQPGFNLQPPGVQITTINKTIEQAREIARTMVKLNPKNSNIMQQAMARKAAIYDPAAAEAK